MNKKLMVQVSKFYVFIAILCIGYTARAQILYPVLSRRQEKVLKYFAFGGSLSAGVTSSGVTVNSQMASFPNLISKQLGLTSFLHPLFDVEFGNKTIDNLASELIFSNDMNTLLTGEILKVKPEIHNLGIPFQTVRELSIMENEPGAFLPYFSKKSYQFLNAVCLSSSEGHSSYSNFIKEKVKNIDFFTWELGYDDFANYFSNGAYEQPISFVNSEREGHFPENEIIRHLLSQGSKGVIANVPNLLEFPIFKYYNAALLTTNPADPVFIQRYGKNDVRRLDSRDILIPTPRMKYFFEKSSDYGRNELNPLLDEEVIDYEEFVSPSYYNLIVEQIAKENKLPVVDLNSLFDKVLKGDYISYDGIKIDPSYPNGNFFNSDGITLSSIGQAIIANEFIRTINSSFGENIPFVSIASIK